MEGVSVGVWRTLLIISRVGDISTTVRLFKGKNIIPKEIVTRKTNWTPLSLLSVIQLCECFLHFVSQALIIAKQKVQSGLRTNQH